MSLAELVSRGEEVTLPGATNQTVTVYPLTLEDIGLLLKDYSESMNGLLGGKIAPREIIKDTPKLAAAVIAYGTKNPTELELARQLPLGHQVTLISKIWELSGVKPADVGKTVSHLLQGLLEAARNVNMQEVREAGTLFSQNKQNSSSAKDTSGAKSDATPSDS